MKRENIRRISAACMSFLLAAGSAAAMPAVSALAAGAVVVNEICTKNTKLAAPDGQFYDYIELYNTGSSEAAVGGYALSDDAAQPRLYVIPDGIRGIASVAFQGCYDLKEITIPASVVSIDSSAFNACDDLVIKAPAGSHAEQFCKQNNIPFIELENDANG